MNLVAGVTLTASPAIVLAVGHGDGDVERHSQPLLHRLDRPVRRGRGGFEGPPRWRYTSGTAAGSATLRVPFLTLPGAYEVRLFAQNGYARLAPPAAVTVI